MNKREYERKQRIEKIIATLKEIANSDKILDEKKFAFRIMFDFGVTKRLAREYLEVAKSQI